MKGIVRNLVKGLSLWVITVCLLSAESRDIQLATDFNRDGYSTLKTGNYEGAIASFSKAIEVSPKMAKAHWNLACAISMGMDTFPLKERATRRKQAYQAIHTAVDIEPDRRSKMISDRDLQHFYPDTEYWIAGGYSSAESEALAAIYNENDWNRGYNREPRSDGLPDDRDNLYKNISKNPKDLISRIAVLNIIVHNHGRDWRFYSDEIVQQVRAISRINRIDGFDLLFRIGIMERIRYEPFFQESKLEEDLENYLIETRRRKKVVRLRDLGLEFELNGAYVFNRTSPGDGEIPSADPCKAVGTAYDITDEGGDAGSGSPVHMEISVCQKNPIEPVGVSNYRTDEDVEQSSSTIPVAGVEAKKMSWVLPGIEMSTQYSSEIYIPHGGQWFVFSFTYFTSYYDLSDEEARKADRSFKENFIDDILGSAHFL